MADLYLARWTDGVPNGFVMRTQLCPLFLRVWPSRFVSGDPLRMSSAFSYISFVTASPSIARRPGM